MSMVGYDVQREWFKKCHARNALHHAYLFEGDACIGKFIFAREFAHYLEYGVFEETREPLLDTFILVPDEKGNIGIDMVHALKNFLWQTPIRSSRRTVIINDAHTLTREAEVSMLKITEEPPLHGLIIFITHDALTLTAPLRSRCIKIYFPRISRAQIINFLHEKYGTARMRAEEIAANAFGSIGRAIMLLEEKKSLEKEISLSEEIIHTILMLRTRDLFRYARRIAWLLSRVNAVQQYNLNPRLQRAAIEFQRSTQ